MANTDVLNSPSVLDPSGFYEEDPPIFFHPDNTAIYLRLALMCGAAAAAFAALMLLTTLPVWLWVAPALAAAGAWHFYGIAKDGAPVLRLYPGKGLKSPQWQGGVGFSLLQGVELQSPNSNNARLVLHLRPGMPWPGKVSLLFGAPSEKNGARDLILHLGVLKPATRKQLHQAVTQHYLRYVARRQASRGSK